MIESMRVVLVQRLGFLKQNIEGMGSRIKTADHRCGRQQGVTQPISHKSHNIIKNMQMINDTYNTEAYALNDPHSDCSDHGKRGSVNIESQMLRLCI